MKDDDFKLLRGFGNRQTDKEMDIGDCRVALQLKIIKLFLYKIFLENCPKDWTFYQTTAIWSNFKPTSMCYKFYKEKSKWVDALSFCKKIYPKVKIK